MRQLEIYNLKFEKITLMRGLFLYKKSTDQELVSTKIKFLNDSSPN